MEEIAFLGRPLGAIFLLLLSLVSCLTHFFNKEKKHSKGKKIWQLAKWKKLNTSIARVRTEEKAA